MIHHILMLSNTNPVIVIVAILILPLIYGTFAVAKSLFTGGMQLHRAVEKNDLESVRKLIGKGVDINSFEPCFEGAGGWTPLHRAKTLEMAELLVQAGANPNIKSRNVLNCTPFYWHFSDNQLREFLIDAGATIYNDENSRDVIRRLIAENQWDLIRKLIDNGSVVDKMTGVLAHA